MFYLTKKNADGDAEDIQVQEDEYRRWLKSELGNKMTPSRLERYIEEKVNEMRRKGKPGHVRL